jgi:orotate phosphoribosyltransferase
MFYKQELCDLDDPREADICVRIIGTSLKSSEWTLTGGLASGNFFDMDKYLLDAKNANELSALIADKITKLSTSHAFDKIGFIDKGGSGPIGLITISSSVADLIKKEIVIIRSKKKLLLAAIKGSVGKGERVMLLNDVATAGWTIFEAAEKVWQAGGTVPYALTVIDRDQGASVSLGRKGIELFSIVSAKTIREKRGEQLETQYKAIIQDTFTPKLVDFGGVSSTSFR